MTDDSNILGQMVSRLLLDSCTKQLILAAEQGTFPDGLWREICELGLADALIPEEHGGFGVALTDAFDIAFLAGRFALPLPLPETMLANRVLAQAEMETTQNPAILITDAGTTLQQHADGWMVSGTAARVPWGRLAEPVIIAAHAGGSFVVHLPASECCAKQGANIAREPRDGLVFDVVVDANKVAAVPDGVTADQLRLYQTTLRTAQMAGAIDRICDMTAAYTLERAQFGRSLAKFQAIQQNMARLAGETAAAGVAARMAAAALNTPQSATQAVAAAKIRVGEATGQVAAIAHQVHGAMGFTQEYDLNFLTRRLWSWRDEAGNETYWAQRLGHALIANGPDQLWPNLTAIQGETP